MNGMNGSNIHFRCFVGLIHSQLIQEQLRTLMAPQLWLFIKLVSLSHLCWWFSVDAERTVWSIGEQGALAYLFENKLFLVSTWRLIRAFVDCYVDSLQADMSDDEEREIEDIINLTDDRYCPQSLEKMIALVALLVEKSRCPDEKTLNLSEKDEHAIIGGKVRTRTTPTILWLIFLLLSVLLEVLLGILLGSLSGCSFWGLCLGSLFRVSVWVLFLGFLSGFSFWGFCVCSKDKTKQK